MKLVPFLQALLSFESNPESSIIQILIHDLEQGEIPIIRSLIGANVCLDSPRISQKIKGFRLIPMAAKCEESARVSTIYFNRLNDLLKRDDLVIFG